MMKTKRGKNEDREKIYDKSPSGCYGRRAGLRMMKTWKRKMTRVHQALGRSGGLRMMKTKRGNEDEDEDKIYDKSSSGCCSRSAGLRTMKTKRRKMSIWLLW